MPYQNAPWPAQTPAAAPGSSSSSSPSSSLASSSSRQRALKRRRSFGISHELSARQVVDQSAVEQAEYNCQVFSGNDVITCFPTEDSVFPQHQWATVVWNSGLPQFTQTKLVNVYLFSGDSRQLRQQFLNQPNPSNQAGSLTSQVNDVWFGEDAANWNGSNLTYTFYWVVTRNDITNTSEAFSDAFTQSHFTAIQTTYADSVLSSMASTSAAGASSTSSPLPSSTASSSTGTNGGTSDGNGNVQSGSDNSGFPHWAIAVIVVLGFLAIATSCILAFFILRRIRRRNAELDSNRNSMGSASPMMAHVGNEPGSPLLATAGAGGIDRHSSVGHGQRPPSIVSPDGASTVSRTGSAGDTGPFSGADAAIMADAFRKALRKPDFAGATVEEGDSPDTQHQGELLNRELADEGRDIRSVSSSRGVRVETLSDSGDTIHDDHR
ncbi:hypothetical protein BDZ89DRAFT_959448 [Hymenopellis radicata]|nr:hypothetical protein BDZ89DRAFT_959448 [Hymenopellis radicata]